MEFSRKELDNLLYNLVYIGSGSQGTCYLDKSTNTVYKVFHSYSDRESSFYSVSDIMSIKDEFNNTYYFPKDVILVNGKVEGYTLDYFKGYNLCMMNPFNINLDSFEVILSKVYSDIRSISDKNILSYDVLYNIMYSKEKLAVIDTLDYTIFSDTYDINRYNFDLGIKLFLVDGYFDHFIYSDILLREFFESKDVSSLEFLKVFRKKLSEYLDYRVCALNDASSLVRKSKHHYIRG